MTQDEIIEMATKVYGECDWHESALHHLEAFANLVAKHEREECIKIVMQGTGEPVQTRTLEIINKERERIVDGIRKHQYD